MQKNKILKFGLAVGTLIVLSTSLINQNKGKVNANNNYKNEKSIIYYNEKEQKLIENMNLSFKKSKEEKLKLLRMKDQIKEEISKLPYFNDEEKNIFSNSIENAKNIKDILKIKDEAYSKNKLKEDQNRIEEEQKALELKRQEEETTTSEKENEETTSIEQETTQAYSVSTPSSVVLPNGNTPGEIGTYAAQRMSQETGIPQSTWGYIIARESGGNPNAYNPSGASGLFQTMPFWGSTATVEDQIQTALFAYNEALRVFGNGLQPWGM